MLIQQIFHKTKKIFLSWFLSLNIYNSILQNFYLYIQMKKKKLSNIMFQFILRH